MNTTRYLLMIVLAVFSSIGARSQVSFPLKISSNQRYLEDQQNVPFPILGRTAWSVISQTVNAYREFIANSKSHGYNAIEMNSICHWPMGNNPPYNGRGYLPFLKRLDGSAWTGSLVYNNKNKEAPDFNTPNEQYWKYVDTLISFCETNEILVFLFPAYVGYEGGEQGWMQELIANGPQKIQAYGSWIAGRYKKSKNLVWMLLGDMGKFTAEQKNVESALITGLKSVAGQQSIHYSAESYGGQNSADQTDFGDQMTLNGVYTWGTVSVPSLGRLAYSHKPVMPAYLLEEPYDEEGPDGNNYNPHAIQPVRRFQWWGWLTTTAGYISGNGYVWPFIDPVWKNHLNTAGALDMGRLNNFIRSISWWNLVPSGMNGMKNLIKAGGSVDTLADYVAAAATFDGTLLVAYIPPAHVGSISVDMTALSGLAQANWYDPTNGTYARIPGSAFINEGIRQFNPPGNNSSGQNDWVLMLKINK